MSPRQIGRELRRRASSLSAREQLLAALIGTALLVGWSLGLLRELTTTRERFDGVEAAEMTQEAWLNAAPALDSALAAQSAGLAAAKNLDPEALMAHLEKLLSAAGLTAESSRPVTRDLGTCRAHFVSLRAESAGMPAIIAFRRALDAARLPMAITTLDLEAADSRDPNLLRTRIEITALQPK